MTRRRFHSHTGTVPQRRPLSAHSSHRTASSLFESYSSHFRMCTEYSKCLTFVAIIVTLVALSAAKPWNTLRSGGVLTTASTTKTVRIQCKTRHFLQIADDGVVNGSTRFNSPNVVLQLQSAGPHGLVHIYSAWTKRYIAMNSKGIVNSTLTPTQDTIFKYEQLPSDYHNFVKNLDGQTPMFLALRDNGKAKKGTKTSRNHRSSLFLEIS